MTLNMAESPQCPVGITPGGPRLLPRAGLVAEDIPILLPQLLRGHLPQGDDLLLNVQVHAMLLL